MGKIKNLKVSMIVAVGKDGAIGAGNDLLWPPESHKADTKNFREYTAGKTVIMGRKMWESIPEQFRPLAGRHNIILSRTVPATSISNINVSIASDVSTALILAKTHGNEVVVIGGAEIYKAFLPHVDEIRKTSMVKELTTEEDAEVVFSIYGRKYAYANVPFPQADKFFPYIDSKKICSVRDALFVHADSDNLYHTLTRTITYK